MKIKNQTKRRITFKGHTSAAALQKKMRLFRKMLARGTEPVKFIFEFAYGGEDTASSLQLAHEIREARVRTESQALGENNSASLLIASSATHRKIDFDCKCLIHPVHLPRNLPATYLDQEGHLPREITQGTQRLHEEYKRMLVSNSNGKLSMEVLEEIMSRNNGHGDVIDAETAVRLGIADEIVY